MLASGKTWNCATLELAESVSKDTASAIATTLQSSKCKAGKLHFALEDGQETLVPPGWNLIALAGIGNPTIESFSISGDFPQFAPLIGNVLETLSVDNSLRYFELEADKFVPSSTWDNFCGDDFIKNLKSNYTVEKLEITGMEGNLQEDCDVICYLNRAGRRYMVDDNTLENGVACLIRLHERNEDNPHNIRLLDCIFTHLRENPVVFFGNPSDTRKRQIEAETSRLVDLKERVLPSEQLLVNLAGQPHVNGRKRKQLGCLFGCLSVNATSAPGFSS